MSIRPYLLHGDQMDAGVFYCMRCDQGSDPAHFVDGHRDGLLSQVEKYRQSKRIWMERKRANPLNRGLFRSKDVRNLFTGGD